MGRMPTRNTTKGAHTRADILRAAADIASVDGLDGLSIGRLANELGMSKSGLFAHFGSKESLQLATIEEARDRYVKGVIEPALSSGSGITRLYALCQAFLSYIERGVFPGGCFFASAMAEFGAKEPSLARDRIVECQEQWMMMLERAAEGARAKGELRAESDSRQLAFELEGALLSANWYFHLFRDATNIERARQAVRTRLSREATPAGLHLLPTRPQGS
jgi:AcrR family transcriptional regulator